MDLDSFYADTQGLGYLTGWIATTQIAEDLKFTLAWRIVASCASKGR